MRVDRNSRGFRPALVMALVLLVLPLTGGVVLSQQAATQANGGTNGNEDGNGAVDLDRRTVPVTTANYELAARFQPLKIRKLVFDTSVNPRWLQDGTRFWYDYETSDGKSFYLVDPMRRSKRPIFDNDDIARQITLLTGDPYDGQHLPITTLKFSDDGTKVRFDVTSSQDEEQELTEGEEREREEQQQEEREERRPPPKKKVHHFEYDIGTGVLRELDDWEEPPNHPSWASISPDKQWVVFGRDHNLFMMSWADYERILAARQGIEEDDEAEEAEKEVEVEEIQLTTDGVEHYGYYSEGRGDTDKERQENEDDRKRVNIAWAKDSSKFSLIRQDRREVGELWVIHSVGNERPELETYKYDMPGEEHVTQSELWVFDPAARSGRQIDVEAFKDQRISVFEDPQREVRQQRTGGGFGAGNQDGEPIPDLWLSDDPNEIYFWRRSRDQHKVDVAVADATTGEVRVVIEERLNTYVEHQTPELLDSGELIWWSERDGWAHFYLFGPDGTLKSQITQGPYSARDVLGVDEEGRTLFFSANGREPGEDPYYEHAYSVGLDGSRMKPLSPGVADHSMRMNAAGTFFVDNHSRVDSTPSSALYDAAGNKLMDLEEADLSLLMEAGYRYPEPYRVKADDGITDLYGVMYKPFDFDPSRRYPIVAYVYPGPQTESVAKAFSTSPSEVALAQFGFIVITVGNRGGHPARSKWYHNYGYGDLRDYGLADKKAAIEQLAARHPFIDIDRVGIYGHSGGGFMSTAAMLVYPDFFKVAVSSSGNHNNDVYNANWSEKHHGIKEVVDEEGEVAFEYDIERNSDLAANLKGHLLLTTGDIDNNVHPAGTLRMAEALIRANKRFDFFVFPGQRHGYGNMGDYWFWLRAEYFVKHLLGDDTHWNADLIELIREQDRSGGRGGRGGGRGGRRGGR